MHKKGIFIGKFEEKRKSERGKAGRGRKRRKKPRLWKRRKK